MLTFSTEMMGQDESRKFLNESFARMLKGGVIMDVTNRDQAMIAQDAGACAIMALERIPSDIRREGGIARMSDPQLIKSIQNAVSIPVMAKCRIGHTAEARILETLGVDFVDESEVLTPADTNQIAKTEFRVPFVCGCTGLVGALRRISEGAVMLRTKGQAGTGNVAEAVLNARSVREEIKEICRFSEKEREEWADFHKIPLPLVKRTVRLGRLPVVTFAAGGIATPADLALLMQLGMDGVFVGSGIFKSDDPAATAKAIVTSVTNYRNPKILAQVSKGLAKGAMQ